MDLLLPNLDLRSSFLIWISLHFLNGSALLLPNVDLRTEGKSSEESEEQQKDGGDLRRGLFERRHLQHTQCVHSSQ